MFRFGSTNKRGERLKSILVRARQAQMPVKTDDVKPLEWN